MKIGKKKKRKEFSEINTQILQNLNDSGTEKDFIEGLNKYIITVGNLQVFSERKHIFEMLISFITKLRDLGFAAHVEFKIGSMYADKKSYDEAIEHLRNSLIIHKDHSVPAKQLMVIEKLTSVADEGKRYGLLINTKELEISVRNNSPDEADKQRIPLVYHELSILYLATQQALKTRYAIEKGLEIADRTGDAAAYAEICKTYSFMLFIAKKHQDAIDLIKGALEKTKAAELHKWTVTMLLNLGSYYSEMNDFNSALQAWQEGENLAQEHNFSELLESIQKHITEVKTKL